MSGGDFIEGAHGDPFDPASLERYENERDKPTEEQSNEVVRMIRRRKEAYARVFTAGSREQEDIDIVLADLMYFCRARAPSYNIADGIHAERLAHMKDGRREVFHRIQDFARLDLDMLLMMYTDAIKRSVT
jgi:hypothetical protein